MENIKVKNIASAENQRTFLDGSKRSAITLDSVIIGRGEYLPGWKWSLHAGPQTGKKSAAHIGYIISGQMVVQSPDKQQVTIGPDEAFEIGPGHDAWVIGNEPCVALDFTALDKK
ncbi:MAG: hypothetical protein WCV50_05970 [Patescibacteria group bacterium]|jgi:hypothetical protein